MQTEVLPVAETVLRGISFSAATAVRSPGAFERGDQRIQPVRRTCVQEKVCMLQKGVMQRPRREIKYVKHRSG